MSGIPKLPGRVFGSGRLNRHRFSCDQRIPGAISCYPSSHACISSPGKLCLCNRPLKRSSGSLHVRSFVVVYARLLNRRPLTESHHQRMITLVLPLNESALSFVPVREKLYISEAGGLDYYMVVEFIFTMDQLNIPER